MFNHEELGGQPITICSHDLIALTAHNNKLLHTEQAAKILNCDNKELEQARETGELWGIPAPSFFYANGKCLYSSNTIGAWISELPQWNKFHYQYK